MTVFIKSGKLLVSGDTYESDFCAGVECPKELEKQALLKGLIKAPSKEQLKMAKK